MFPSKSYNPFWYDYFYFIAQTKKINLIDDLK